MKSLKNLRLRFQGELQDIHLVNFSVEAAELAGRIPEPIRPRTTAGRALISLVDVSLRNMRVQAAWTPFRFHYQHIGFRVLVQDAQWNSDHAHRGIFFLQSFTDRPAIAWAGNLLGNFRFETAHLANYPAGLRLEAGKRWLHYHLAGPLLHPDVHIQSLQAQIGDIDRAWAVVGNELRKTQILRERWPLQPMNCIRFGTNFFETARFEAAFRVPEPIHYTWLPPETVLRFPTHPHRLALTVSHV